MATDDTHKSGSIKKPDCDGRLELVKTGVIRSVIFNTVPGSGPGQPSPCHSVTAEPGNQPGVSIHSVAVRFTREEQAESTFAPSAQ